jgi:hypothetical protein
MGLAALGSRVQTERSEANTAVAAVATQHETVAPVSAPSRQRERPKVAPKAVQKCVSRFGLCVELPRLERAAFLPYEPEERGKFVELCFDRPLRPREYYPFKMKIAASGGAQFECHNYVSYDISAHAAQPTCHRYNLFVSCLGGRHTPPEQRAAMDTQVHPAMVQRLDFQIASPIDSAHVEERTFRDL